MKGSHIRNDITILNEKDYFCYADTDSLHILRHPRYNELLDVDSKKLGWWKLESDNITRAKFLRAKTYIEDKNGELDIKCAGMTDKIKEIMTFEDFNYGYINENLKLRPKKVIGGVILEPTPFTIKEPSKKKMDML